MLVEKYKDLLPDTYSEEDKQNIIKDLTILSELILENEDLLKILNLRKI